LCKLAAERGRPEYKPLPYQQRLCSNQSNEEQQSMSTVAIAQVEHPNDIKEFIELPWKIYQNYPNWVPPLKKYMRRLLDEQSHPYWEFASRKLFLARRNGQTVGRIAAIVDTRFNRYQKTGAGIWGFFECENDPEAAQALFSAAGDWAASQGMTYLLGPFCPSTNYEIGMLIEGFEHLATFMMPFNPPYYVELAETCHLMKEKDLLSFIVDRSWEYPQWMLNIAEKLNNDARFSVRTPSRSTDRVEDVVALIRKIYDECWADNWGFVPATEGEVQELAKELERFADEDLIFFIYFNEEPIGAALMVPDVNPLLKRLNGKIGILGPLKYLLFKKEIRGVRGLLLGIKREYQDMGVPFFLLYHALDRTKNKQQYQYLELGWNLEDNHDINQLEMDGGAKLFKKYRIYRKNLMDRW